MKAVLIPGDGIGKEISKSVVDITKAMNLDIEWMEYQAGGEYAAKTKEVFEPGLIDAIKEYLKVSIPQKEEIFAVIKDIVANVNKKLPNYKHIKSFIIKDEEFEKTTTQKIKRFGKNVENNK